MIKTIEEMKKERQDKMLHNKDYVVYHIVKPLADLNCWSSSHENCLRAGSNETEEHIRAKFERWLFHRKVGNSVFTELILKKGGRPDLVVITKFGGVVIEEIIKSEEAKSIERKKEKYPFEVVEFHADVLLEGLKYGK